MTPKTIRWVGDTNGHVELIDQTLLPVECRILSIRSVKTLWEAIRMLRIRGAPAIGIAAAYGLVLGLQDIQDDASREETVKKINESADYLATSRPTAVNLFWALDRMRKTAASLPAADTKQLKERLLVEAEAIRDEDAASCRAIGRHGADLIPAGGGVLTHCNAGGLATAEYGTALALMFAAREQGNTSFRVYADETRPLLQGARLTCWELMQAGIDTTLICDNMAGHLMGRGMIDLVVTGADRIAANGDTANKIGTYSLAVLARAHEIPFYVAAPTSSFDLSIPDGSQIPIEMRQSEEVTHLAGQPTAPPDVQVYNPAFDVTPHEYIAAIVTEKGIITKPNSQSVREHFNSIQAG
ncbi:MAG: S-methyl-5-thioribose-1-phosphate isomerase [Sedimentisphaerales bacterium]|nr:S-methyl-5-thioribose-1-phosphate isomerase [Sedimentisphaerales bacterium]